ncbi:PREDICTED: platelet basic protein-like [Chinchilla lanigera]|uniref:C-X-C motif chemokine n=1 Tax=Chinchilla lanigera TaxID=34839 RepID=A0A8C2V3X9_CHILA|nr:PREDICTED: platelet basic protein-like [Chinchilla lanigera]
MSLRLQATSSCLSVGLHRVLGGLLLLSLLLTLLVPSSNGQPESIDMFAELRCLCVRTVSGMHPSKISSLEVIKAGAHCPKVQVIATLKEGKKFCLDPDAPGVKKLVQKILEGRGLAA